MSFRVCASFSYKYHQTSPDHGLSACLLLEFASAFLLRGHIVGTKHDCRGVAKSVNSAAPVHLVFHVTSEQIGGYHLQVGPCLTIVHGVGVGRIQESTPPQPSPHTLCFRAHTKGFPLGCIIRSHINCVKPMVPQPLANIYHTTGKPGKKNK